ncbi:BREX system P-loop protein BrxC, partial [bacterium]|nr:BREX system P-loop protein BrxC [bacterium]
PTCQQPVGWLATMVTVFDVMERDIEVASPNIYAAYKKVNIRFPDSEIHIGIGKTVALLQILNNIPITNKNVAALLHCSITDSSKLDEIDAAIDELINDTMVPFDYREGQLCFLSERLSEIQKTRGEIPPRSVETRRIFNSVIKEVFDPLPSRKIFDSLTVTAGIKTRSGTQESALAGERNSIQLIVDFVTGDDLESRKTELEDESRTNAGRNNIYIIGKKSDDFDKAVNEIYRSEEISRRFRNDADEEVRSYCNSQNDRAAEEARKLKSAIEKSLYEGMFIFRAAETAVDSEGSRLAESCKKFLGEEVADSVFDKYEQAPVRVDTGVAESFLRNDNLSSMTAKHDPLGLVQEEGGTWNIDIDHPAINSIRDYLQSQGSLEGKQLSNKFTAVPYGWSQDTLRYLIAAMLYASELKIKVGGNWILSPGQKAIDSLKNNNAFKNVMVSLRDSKPNPADLAKAAQRLTELTGNQVLPLEQDIAKAAAKFFASVQNEYGALAERLKNLKLPCADSIEDVCNRMSESIQADCSDAVTRLGAGDETFEKLKLAARLKAAFSNGLDKTISALHLTMERIQDLPDAGPAGQLKKDTEEHIQNLKTRISAEDFFEHGPEYASALTSLENAIGETAKQLAADQIENIEQAKKSLTQMPDWPFLTQQRKSEILGQLDVFRLPADPSYEGVKRQLDARYEMTEKLNELRKLVVPPKPSEPKTPGPKPKKLKDKLILPAKLNSLDDFSNLNQSVQAAQHKARTHAEFEIEIELKE